MERTATPSADPAVAGFVASLEHPGGNITGITEMMPELTPQWLGMLKQIVPALSRAAILWRPGTLSGATIEKVKEARPDGADIRLQLVAASRDPVDVGGLPVRIDWIEIDRAEALAVEPDQLQRFGRGNCRLMPLLYELRPDRAILLRDVEEFSGFLDTNPVVSGYA